MTASLIRAADLPSGEHSASVSFFLSRNSPGTGPSLHTHPYDETFMETDWLEE
jgi:hypothetical protein